MDLLEEHPPDSNDNDSQHNLDSSERSNVVVSADQLSSNESLLLPQHSDLDESTSINSDVANIRTPDENTDVYVRNGYILRGEEATIAKALHHIEESCRGSRSFRITLRHPDLHEHREQLHQDYTEDGIVQEGDMESECHDQDPLRSSQGSPSIESDGNNENTQQLGEEDSSSVTEVNLDISDEEQPHQMDVHSNVHCSDDDALPSEHNFQPYIGFGDTEDDSQILPSSYCSGDDYDTDDSDFHTELVQNVSELCSNASRDNSNGVRQTDGNEQDSQNPGEHFDTHRSLEQQPLINVKVITKVNEHSISKVTSTKEVLEQKSTKAIGEVTAATTDVKVINEKFQCLTSDTKVRGGEVRVATVDAKGIDTKVQTGTIVSKIEGADLEVAAADVKGMNVQTGASVNVTTKAVTTAVGSVNLAGADVDVQATAEATAQGLSSNVGAATITGVREKAKMNMKATASGVEVQAGVADVTGIKTGVTAEATVEATGVDVKIGTAQVTGAEISATASATARVGTEVSIGNLRASGFDGVGARASIKAKAGVELFNINVGISGNVGANVSTTPKFGCITIAPGLPKIGIGTGHFNIGIGGGIEGESGQYTGVATAGNSKANSGRGNQYGGESPGEGDGHGSNAGGKSSNNTSGTSALSLAGGSFEAPSGLVILNPVSGHITLGNSVPSGIHSSGASVESGGNNNVNAHHKQDNGHATSESSVHHGKKSGDIEGCYGNSEVLDPSEQPFHLKALHTLKQHHLGKGNDKQNKLRSPGRQPAGHALTSGRQASEHDSQVEDSGAKSLQAMINERYPSLPGESGSNSDMHSAHRRHSSESDIEHVKKSAIKRLSNQGKADSMQSAVSDSTSSRNTSANSPNAKMSKPSGPNKNIYTLDCFRMESSKEVVRINSRSSEKYVAGFKDQDD